jgi:hypothetical protein
VIANHIADFSLALSLLWCTHWYALYATNLSWLMVSGSSCWDGRPAVVGQNRIRGGAQSEMAVLMPCLAARFRKKVLPVGGFYPIYATCSQIRWQLTFAGFKYLITGEQTLLLLVCLKRLLAIMSAQGRHLYWQCHFPYRKRFDSVVYCSLSVNVWSLIIDGRCYLLRENHWSCAIFPPVAIYISWLKVRRVRVHIRIPGLEIVLLKWPHVLILSLSDGSQKHC